MDYITIELSKKGKYAGLYKAIVSPEDEILSLLNWRVLKSRNHNKTEYAYRTTLGTKDRIEGLLHRVVLERALQRKLLPHEQVDHINLNGLDCRRENLRLADGNQNQYNRKKMITNKSGIKGVHWHKREQKWAVSIRVDNKTIWVGYFTEKSAAARARREAANKYHKEFVNHGETDAKEK